MKLFTGRIPLKEYLLYITLITFGVIYFTIVFCNHYFFRTATWDYGAYNFALYDFSHFRISECPAYGWSHKNFMQDHLSFTMFLFIPLYWIIGWITGTYTLLLIQTSFILYGGWCIYKLIALKTNEKYFPLLALLQYFTIFGRWTSFVSDCNLAIIAASSVPIFLYYFEKRKYYHAGFAFAFILITREDMALWTCFIGLFLLISHYRDKELRLASIIIVITSLIYFIIVFKVLIPFIETPEEKFILFNYSVLGSNPSEASIFILHHPWKTFTMLFLNQGNDPSNNFVKCEFYYIYVISGAFLLFFRPKYLLLFIPLLAKKMLNDDPIRWGVQLYYSIEFVTILPIAVFLILSEFKNKRLKYGLTVLVCILSLTMTLGNIFGRNTIKDWWGDRKYAFYKGTMYHADFEANNVYRHLSIVPQDAKISCTNLILPHLAFREKAYYFPRVGDAEYIVAFNFDAGALSQEDFRKKINEYKADTTWNIVVDDSPLLIFKKK